MDYTKVQYKTSIMQDLYYGLFVFNKPLEIPYYIPPFSQCVEAWFCQIRSHFESVRYVIYMQ